jgi:hypothetical protein
MNPALYLSGVDCQLWWKHQRKIASGVEMFDFHGGKIGMSHRTVASLEPRETSARP